MTVSLKEQCKSEPNQELFKLTLYNFHLAFPISTQCPAATVKGVVGMNGLMSLSGAAELEQGNKQQLNAGAVIYPGHSRAQEAGNTTGEGERVTQELHLNHGGSGEPIMGAAPSSISSSSHCTQALHTQYGATAIITTTLPWITLVSRQVKT